MRITVSVSLLTIALSGCGSSENNQADNGEGGASGNPLCVPGQQVTCGCPGGEPGAQACREDGAGFLPCECGGNGGGGGDSGSGPDAGNDGDSGNGPGDAGADSGDKICSETSQKAKGLPLDMYIMLDKSGSMQWSNSGNSLPGGASNADSRWYQVTKALKSFVADPKSAGLGVGLGYFPGSPECNIDTYKTPAVGIGLLPLHATSIEGSLDETSPTGGTPTRHALEGALQHAKERSDSHPDHTVIVVLATDGEPSGCTSNSMTDVKNVASSYATQGIKTFVIGIGNQTGNLDGIAAAGGTSEAIMVIGQNAEQQFVEAMNEIRGAALPCEYAIPMPEPGKAIDLEKVNLRFTAFDGTTTDIPYLENAGQCGAGGWFYDNATTPTKILACPETCDVFKTDHQGEVNIVLGCKTREK